MMRFPNNPSKECSDVLGYCRVLPADDLHVWLDTDPARHFERASANARSVGTRRDGELEAEVCNADWNADRREQLVRTVDHPTEEAVQVCKSYTAARDHQGHSFSLRSIFLTLRRLDDRLNDLWIGDLIGAAFLFFLLFVMACLPTFVTAIVGAYP